MQRQRSVGSSPNFQSWWVFWHAPCVSVTSECFAVQVLIKNISAEAVQVPALESRAAASGCGILPGSAGLLQWPPDQIELKTPGQHTKQWCGVLPTAHAKLSKSSFVTKPFHLSRLVNSFISNLFQESLQRIQRRKRGDGVRKEGDKELSVKKERVLNWYLECKNKWPSDVALQITVSVGKKSLLNVKFSLKIRVSIHAGCFTSFLPLLPSWNVSSSSIYSPYFRLSYGTVKVTFEFPFHQLKEKQPQTLDGVDAGIRAVYCLHVSCCFV